MKTYYYRWLNGSDWSYVITAKNRKQADIKLIETLQELGHSAVLWSLVFADKDSDIVKVTVRKEQR